MNFVVDLIPSIIRGPWFLFGLLQENNSGLDMRRHLRPHLSQSLATALWIWGGHVSSAVPIRVNLRICMEMLNQSALSPAVINEERSVNLGSVGAVLGSSFSEASSEVGRMKTWHKIRLLVMFLGSQFKPFLKSDITGYFRYMGHQILFTGVKSVSMRVFCFTSNCVQLSQPYIMWVIERPSNRPRRRFFIGEGYRISEFCQVDDKAHAPGQRRRFQDLPSSHFP